jgi:ABC-2 type transport system ATP-binding protein
MNVIEVVGVEKRFGKTRALDKISFAVSEGTVTGFLGPNGAGKSTTMNILLGFISANAGNINIFGEKVSVSSKTRKDVGFLSNSFALDKTLTAGQEIEYFANLNGKYDSAEVENFAKRLDLDLKAKIGSLSTGNSQKVGLIIALLGDPKLLILDEPTNGLDPLVQAEFAKIIAEKKAEGATVFISSHILSEISDLCDSFIFVKKGKIVGEFTKAELAKRSATYLRVEETSYNVKVLKENGVRFTVDEPDLESVFMSFYKDEKGEGK